MMATSVDVKSMSQPTPRATLHLHSKGFARLALLWDDGARNQDYRNILVADAG